MFRNDITNDFILKELNLLKAKNIGDRSSIDSINAIEDDHDNLLKQVNSGDYEFDNLERRQINAKRFVYIASLKDQLVLKFLKSKLEKAYKDVKIANRQYMIETLKSCFLYNDKQTIIKLDVSKFFDEIGHRKLIEKLNKNTALPSNVLKLTERFLNSNFFDNGVLKNTDKGVFQGVSLSSILSEIFMESFDYDLRKKIECSFYFRYVDDIIIFFNRCLEKDELIDILNKVLNVFNEYNLRLNFKKTTIVTLLCESSSSTLKNRQNHDGYCKISRKNPELKKYSLHTKGNQIEGLSEHLHFNTTIKIDFLGYSFQYLVNSKKVYQDIDISLKKKKKIKNRIHQSFEDYYKSYKLGDKQAYYVLREKLRFIYQQTVLPDIKDFDNKFVISGNCYNYKHLTSKREIFDLSSYGKCKIKYFAVKTRMTNRRIKELNSIVSNINMYNKINFMNKQSLLQRVTSITQKSQRNSLVAKDRKDLIGIYMKKITIK